MSREKQIDKMANDIEKSHWKIVQDFMGCHINSEEMAEHLYNAGYRKQEWISVEEGLPEEKSVERLKWDNETLALLDVDTDLVSDEVLVTVIDHEHEEKVFVATDCTVNGQWANFYEVTHWMPFPEAPKMKGGTE